MLNYAFISLLAIKLVEWGGKSFSQSTDRTETSYKRLTYMTPLTLKLKLMEKLNLEYEFRFLAMLNYAFIYLLATKLVEWGGKSFLESTDRPKPHNRVMYMTPLTVKLKLRERFEI